MFITTEKKILLRTRVRQTLADTLTPVSIYLRVRDRFQQAVLLESNDFRSAENCFSFIGLDPIASFSVLNGQVEQRFPDGTVERSPLTDFTAVPDQLQTFIRSFQPESVSPYPNGFFGYAGYDAVQYFDTHRFDPEKRKTKIPDLHYALFRYVIAINHFQEELFLLENIPPGQTESLDQLEAILQNGSFGTHPFELRGSESSNLTDAQYLEMVRAGQRHCQLGDVFQLVLSRQFRQSFRGDDFNVYRILRSVNPSPYLFYFDYGNYRIFGSSPEAQMVIQDGSAAVNPIAGTYRRSGNDAEDRRRAAALAADPKENAEHIMLVDLARNDLGRHAREVTVRQLKEIQYFSHVIHLVSRVEGKLTPDTNPIRVFADTFPAGTLSGAPKYKAIELIDRYEPQNRSFYGGAIGYISFEGNMNQAILIRSFLSKGDTLYYQAGAGIVAASNPENELQEVHNKVDALRKALAKAAKI